MALRGRITSPHVAVSVADDSVDTDAIEDDAVTYAKIQNVSADERILGRVSGADGVIEELTKTQVLTFANVENGADVTDTTNVTAAGALMDSELAGIAAVKATTGTFLSADESKLDGIEASADVTDATNVTAAGALMDSELAGIAAVKATTGTFLSADESKLDGIEASATADQTAGEVLTLIEDGVDSVHYVNNSVDAVHLFDLARGSVIIGNASANTVELTVGSDNYVLTVDSSGDIGWEAAGAVSGAQTGITTILNTSTKIGRDSENLVDFA